jgi:hypothetical protein
MIRRYLLNRKRASAKTLWANKRSPCEYSSLIYEAALPATWRRLFEFGANWGGNLQYFLARHPAIQATGVDINPAVLELQATLPNYRGIVGDESALEDFGVDAFDLAWTVSVLDHIPSEDVVRSAIAHLARISTRVLLLEPWIEGVHGDVSGRIRNAVRPGLPGSHKPFAPHSYLWNYDAMLQQLGVPFTKRAAPLHAHSLGPFYYLYDLGRRP